MPGVVTARVERYVRQRFAGPAAESVLGALREWRISYEAESPSERLMAAVVLLAEGRPERLADGFRLAEQDWRDLLVVAGLADADWERVLDSRLGPAAG